MCSFSVSKGCWAPWSFLRFSWLMMLCCNCNHETSIYLPFAAALSSITPTLIWALGKPAHTQGIGCFRSHPNDIVFVLWVTSILPRQYKVLTLPPALFWKLRIWTPTMHGSDGGCRKQLWGSPLCLGRYMHWLTPITESALHALCLRSWLAVRTVRFDPPVSSRCYECFYAVFKGSFSASDVRLTVCKFSLWLALLQMVQKKAGVGFDATLKKPEGSDAPSIVHLP